LDFSAQEKNVLVICASKHVSADLVLLPKRTSFSAIIIAGREKDNSWGSDIYIKIFVFIVMAI
jgi:hypothetical protein